VLAKQCPFAFSQMCDERGDVADLIEANSEIAVLL